MCIGMKENLMVSKILLFFWATRKKHLEIRKHCGLFSAPLYHYQPMKSCPVVCRWQIEAFFWKWKDKLALGSYKIRSARESGGTGYWCHWHIIYVLQGQKNHAFLKTDINGYTILSNRNSIGICFNVQGKAMTLTRLWNWQCSFVQFFKFAHL